MITIEDLSAWVQRSDRTLYLLFALGIAWTFVHVVLDERWQRAMNDRMRDCLMYQGRAIDEIARAVSSTLAAPASPGDAKRN
jgi:hypothetical protein